MKWLAPSVSAENLDTTMPQSAAEPITQETEEEWRARVARELRISREPKRPPTATKTYLDKDTEELFSAYIQSKDKPKRGDTGS